MIDIVGAEHSSTMVSSMVQTEEHEIHPVEQQSRFTNLSTLVNNTATVALSKLHMPTIPFIQPSIARATLIVTRTKSLLYATSSLVLSQQSKELASSIGTTVTEVTPKAAKVIVSKEFRTVCKESVNEILRVLDVLNSNDIKEASGKVKIAMRLLITIITLLGQQKNAIEPTLELYRFVQNELQRFTEETQDDSEITSAANRLIIAAENLSGKDHGKRSTEKLKKTKTKAPATATTTSDGKEMTKYSEPYRALWFQSLLLLKSIIRMILSEQSNDLVNVLYSTVWDNFGPKLASFLSCDEFKDVSSEVLKTSMNLVELASSMTSAFIAVAFDDSSSAHSLSPPEESNEIEQGVDQDACLTNLMKKGFRPFKRKSTLVPDDTM